MAKQPHCLLKSIIFIYIYSYIYIHIYIEIRIWNPEKVAAAFLSDTRKPYVPNHSQVSLHAF